MSGRFFCQLHSSCGSVENSNGDTVIVSESDDMSYLDSIYINLRKAGVKEEVIDMLFNYVLTELFDTEALDIDLQIETGGNIENIITNKRCIDIIKNMYHKANSYV